jgi:hypothetical protein
LTRWTIHFPCRKPIVKVPKVFIPCILTLLELVKLVSKPYFLLVVLVLVLLVVGIEVYVSFRIGTGGRVVFRSG